LPNASANSFVANAISLWTSVPTAALGAASGGQLAEDVNGSNVTVNSDGTISIPFDIQPSATGTPIGVVYDSDGAVTNALLGSGAGDSSQCFSNAEFGGNDNYGSLAIYQHALVVINGQCAQQSSQLVDLEYRLVRVLGTVLGLGWSQVNLNVITGQADGVTPVAGATVGWSATNSLQLSACSNSSSCPATTDQYGETSTWLIPAVAGTANITATLDPGVYSALKSASATLNANESGSDIGVLTPSLWIAQGAILSVPLTVRVVSNGTPQNTVTVNFTNYGSGTLNAANAQTNASGYATVTLSLTQFTTMFRVVACVTNTPTCQAFVGTPVAAYALQLCPSRAGDRSQPGRPSNR
jgi:hypothetical protein